MFVIVSHSKDSGFILLVVFMIEVASRLAKSLEPAKISTIEVEKSFGTKLDDVPKLATSLDDSALFSGQT